MMKNFGYKTLVIVQALIIVTISIIAWSPKSHVPLLHTTSVLDFPNTAAGTVNDLTVSLTGAEDGDGVVIGIPNGATVANGHFVGWVSMSGQVTVRFFNNSLLTAYNPASATFEIIAFKK